MNKPRCGLEENDEILGRTLRFEAMQISINILQNPIKGSPAKARMEKVPSRIGKPDVDQLCKPHALKLFGFPGSVEEVGILGAPVGLTWP